MQIKAPKDFWAGLMFIAFGVGFAVVAQNYSMGTATRMGPAFFPTVLGVILALLGLAIASRGLIASGEAVPRFHLRPMIVILVALILFGMLLRPFGLVAACVALICTSVLAAGTMRITTIVLLAVGLTVFSVAVFHYGLGLPFKIWPWQ